MVYLLVSDIFALMKCFGFQELLQINRFNHFLCWFSSMAGSEKGTIGGWQGTTSQLSEPVFLNVYGAPESIPRNEFRQPI
jgi:hypothetical protein